MTRKVPNIIPTITLDQPRIAIIGEAPGGEEEAFGRPFCGASGRLLDGMLGKAGILRATCLIGNVYQYRPPGNEIYTVDKSSPLWHESVEQLRADLLAFNPVLIIALGGTALETLTGKTGIMRWRGSVLPCTFIEGPKVVPTIHPAAVLRIYIQKRLVDFDLARAREESLTPVLTYPQRKFIINPGFGEAISYLKNLEGAGKISFDIENTRKGGLLCVGFSASADEAICVPMDSRWSPLEYLELLRAMQHLLTGTDGKIAQNAQHDILCLAYHYGILTRGLWMDTMLAHHACYPELRKSLALICSLYTREPYYKDEAKVTSEDDKETNEKIWSNSLLQDDTFKERLYKYNCKDVCVTYESAMVLDKLLDKLDARRGYALDMLMLDVAMAMTFRGVLVDQKRALTRIEELQANVDKLTAICKGVVGRDFNVKSPKDMAKLLYDELHLPKQYEKGKLTANAAALIKLARKTGDQTLKTFLKIRQLRTHQAFFDPGVYGDGRLHASFNVAGTKTGRWSSSASQFEGRSLMNIPSGEQPPFINCRDIYVADSGMMMIGWDKSQAESRVVAYKSWLCTGDSSYKDLIESGVKPHVWLGHKLCDRGVFSIKKENLVSGTHEYYIAKKGIHGFSYRMGHVRFCGVLAEETDGEILLPNKVAEEIKYTVYSELSAIPKWQQVIENYLQSSRRMVNCFGRSRIFFDRWGDDLVGEACAFEPQSTVADDVATSIRRIYDQIPEVEILQQNYDSMLGQCPIEKVEDVMARMKVLAEQPITLYAFNGNAQVTFTIPVEMKVGPSWGEMKEIK